MVNSLSRALYSQGNKQKRYYRSLAKSKAHLAELQPAVTVLYNKAISKKKQQSQEKTSDILCVHVRPGERNSGAQGPRRTSLHPSNTHSYRESCGYRSSMNLCLWGSVQGTFPSPPMCSHVAESHRERGWLQPSSSAATWLPQG